MRQKINAIFAFAPAAEKAAKLLFREALSDERALVLCKIAGLFARGSAAFGDISRMMTVFCRLSAVAAREFCTAAFSESF